MVLRHPSALKPVQLQADTQAHHQPSFLSMVECPNKQCLNPPDRSLANHLKARSQVNKAMVDHKHSLLLNTLTSRWHTVGLPALAAMVVAPQLPTLSGQHQQARIFQTAASVHTRDRLMSSRRFWQNFSASSRPYLLYQNLRGL
jgi:hypothetical protein